MGMQLLLYVWSLRQDWFQLFSGESRRISEAVLAPEGALIPRIGWLVSGTSRIGLDQRGVVNLLWWILLVAGLLLLVGLFCRTVSITACLLHVATVKSSNIFSYGVDGFTTTGLFLLAVSPLPDRFAMDRNWRSVRPRWAELSGFFRRVLQLHLCLAYFFSGLNKALGSGWWNGDNMWRALVRPPFNVLDPAFVQMIKPSLPFLGCLVWLLELGYIVFMWPARTRLTWLAGILGMHIGIGIFMGMPSFALVMIVLNVAAFGPLDRNASSEKLDLNAGESGF